MKNSLEKILFLLLIKDRPVFFNRWLKFHANEIRGEEIIIYDGEKKSIFSEDLEIVKTKKTTRYSLPLHR